MLSGAGFSPRGTCISTLSAASSALALAFSPAPILRFPDRDKLVTLVFPPVRFLSPPDRPSRYSPSVGLREFCLSPTPRPAREALRSLTIPAPRETHPPGLPAVEKLALTYVLKGLSFSCAAQAYVLKGRSFSCAAQALYFCHPSRASAREGLAFRTLSATSSGILILKVLLIIRILALKVLIVILKNARSFTLSPTGRPRYV